MSNIRESLKLIREGAVDFDSSLFLEDGDSVAFYEAGSSILELQAVSLLSEATNAKELVQKAFVVLRDKLEKFFMWLLRKLGIYQNKYVKQIMARKADILKYKGGKFFNIHENQFNPTFTPEKVKAAFTKQMDIVQKLKNRSNFLYDTRDIKHVVQREILHDILGIPTEQWYVDSTLVGYAFGAVKYRELKRDDMQKLIDQAAAFDKFMDTITDLNKQIKKELVAVEQVYVDNVAKLGEVPKTIQYIADSLYGIMSGVNTVGKLITDSIVSLYTIAMKIADPKSHMN